MKKEILIGLILFSSILTINAQWNSNGDNSTTGNISIGGQINSKAPAGVTSSTWDIRSSASIQGNLASIDQNDDKFYPIVAASSWLNGLGFWNVPSFGYMRPTNNMNGDIVIQNSGDGLAAIRWKFKPDGSFVALGNINSNGQINSKAPTGVTSSTWDIRSSASIQGNLASIDQNDDKFYPIVAASSWLNGLGFWNVPSFGYMRPTNNMNGDIVIQNSGDGLAAIRWKFKPNGDFVASGHIHAIGGYYTGNVLIGKTTQTTAGGRYKLDVAGPIRADEIVVNTTGADFVFEPTYKLRSLCEVETFIKQHKHLPDISPAIDMQTNGASLGDMQTKLLQKLEESTLYLIEQAKQIEALKKEN